MTGPTCTSCGKLLNIGAQLHWDAQERHGTFRVHCRNDECKVTSGIALITEQALADHRDVSIEGDGGVGRFLLTEDSGE